MKARARSLTENLLILALALVPSAVLAEMGLRLFHPVYEYAAEFRYEPSSTRIWRNHPGGIEQRRHPDTAAPHWLIHNNLGSHQHRDFSEQQLADGINVAFFGDSFTENRRLPSFHSFTELLDYLLNLHGRSFNVLNFGVDGYGTDQSYLAYEELRQSVAMDWVFYLMVDNDLENLRQNELFLVDENGGLNRIPARPTPWYIRIAARLHLTYLLYDVRGRLDPSRRGLGSDRALLHEEYTYYSWKKRFRATRRQLAEDRDHPIPNRATPEDAVIVMWRLLDEWQQAVDSSAGRFVVAGVPREQEHELLSVIGEKHETLDLFGLFRSQLDAYEYHEVSFENDAHWNERGNMLAAIVIYRFLEERMGLDPIPEMELRKAVGNYYAAFPESWQAGPEFPPTSLDAITRQAIRTRYTKLEALLQAASKAW